MPGRFFEEDGTPIVTPLRLAVAVVPGTVVAVVGMALRRIDVGSIGLALVLAVLCAGIPLWHNRRYRGRPRPAPPTYAPPPVYTSAHTTPVVEAGARQAPQQVRRIVRRRAGMAYVFAALGAFMCLAVVLAPGPVDAVTAGFAALGAFVCVGCVAAGPVARFVVSTRYLEIRTAARIVRVPRALIGGFEPGRQDVTLRLTNYDSLTFRVDSILWALLDKRVTFTNPRSQIRVVERIVAALAAVPPEHRAEDFAIECIPRFWMVALLVAFGLALFAATLAVAG